MDPAIEAVKELALWCKDHGVKRMSVEGLEVDSRTVVDGVQDVLAVNVNFELADVAIAEAVRARVLASLSPEERERAEKATREQGKEHSERMRYFSTHPNA